MQRRKVDLPEPDGPIRQTTSFGLTAIEIPLRTSRRPNHLWTASALTTGSPPVCPPRLIAMPPKLLGVRIVVAPGDPTEDAIEERLGSRCGPASSVVALQEVLADREHRGRGEVPDRDHDQERNHLEVLRVDQLALYSSSGTAITLTSELFFSIEIVSLPVGGMITRIACGSTI